MTDTQHKNNRIFYTLVLTQVLSIIGTRISGIAIGIYIYQLTGNATPLALVAFFATVPMIVAGGVAGVLADRWDRRTVMILSDTGQALCTLLLLISFTSGNFELWHLYVLVVIQSVFGVFQGPAFQATITLLIPDEQRNRANAIQQLTGPAAGIIAPAAAGVIYAIGGISLAILVDLTTFLAAVMILMTLKIPRPAQTEIGKKFSGTFRKEIWSGLSYLRQNRPLLYCLLYVSLINFLFAGIGVLLTPYILGRTDNDTVALGGLQSIQNVGAIAGALALGIWGGTRRRINTIMPGIIIASIVMIGAGMAQHVIIMGIMFFLFMFPMPIINGLFMSLLQAKVPPDVQGRVFAVVGQISQLLMPITFLLVGPIADNIFSPAVNSPNWATFAPLVGTDPASGYGLMMVIVGGLGAIITLIAWSIPVIRNLETLMPDYIAEASPITPDTESPIAPLPDGQLAPAQTVS